MVSDVVDASNDLSLCCNFDLQKILTTPRSNVSTMYYLSKLNVWNFTIFDAGLAEVNSYVWNETVGNRGSNEIASNLKIFMEEKVKTRVKKLIFYIKFIFYFLYINYAVFNFLVEFFFFPYI